jgi:predicted MFS family arabinose efflux permease
MSVGKPKLLNAALLANLLASVGAMVSFYLLFSVVPMYAVQNGASQVGAGMITGCLMLTTVLTELAMPRLVHWFGYRRLFAAGLVLLGAPALLLLLDSTTTFILLVCALRGIGLAIVVVLGSALVACTVPAERRGEGLGVFGLVTSAPAIAALPLGVWLVDRFGYTPIFFIGALAAFAGLFVMSSLPAKPREAANTMGVLAGLRSRDLRRPCLVMLASAMSAGLVTTFLPLAFSAASSGTIALALLVHSLAAAASRFWAGRIGDRHGQARLLTPALIACACGLLALVVTDSTALMLLGMAMCGAGLGVASTATLALMFERVPRSGYDMASALQSIAYDAGLGLGASAFGVFAAQIGYPFAFASIAALMLAAVTPMRAARRRSAGEQPAMRSLTSL